jgi:hypothetical protein
MLAETSDGTPAGRARQYRALAKAAKRDSAKTPLPSLRMTYLRSAQRWYKLAALLELGRDHSPRKIAQHPAT